MKKSLCIFIHYDESMTYTKDDMSSLQKISSVFDEVIVLTSNKEKIYNIKNIHTYCNMHNIASDFGKLETFINSIDIDDYEDMYVFNNSCLIVRELETSIQSMKKKYLDFWGYTTSTEHTIHIQSYFLYYSNKAMHLLKEFLNKNSPVNNNLSHKDVIEKIELKLLKYMHNNGMKCGSYMKTHILFPSVNPTIIYADKLLIFNPHFPFIKKKTFTLAKIFDRKYLESLV